MLAIIVITLDRTRMGTLAGRTQGILAGPTSGNVFVIRRRERRLRESRVSSQKYLNGLRVLE